MSLSLSSLYSLASTPSPDDRLPVTPARFFFGVLPAYLCYYVMAVLVTSPGTKIYRMSLMPLGVFLAFRAATSFDYAAGDPAQNFQNDGQCVCTF